MIIIIKRMETDEEIKGKAFVHFQSWQEAYSGIVKQAYLDERTIEKCERIANNAKDNTIIAVDGERVVGFVQYGKYNYGDLENAGEIIALYVLADYYGKGIGNRDFDIAWAMFRRPGQKFMKTEAEQYAFLKGYQQVAPCDRNAIHYYMAQCYVYFLQFSGDDAEYCDFIRSWLKRLKEGLI